MQAQVVRAAFLAYIILLALPLSSTNGYHLFGNKWIHPITYCNQPQLIQAMRLWEEHAAIPDGGVSSTPDITCTVESLPTGLGGYAGPVLVPDGTIRSCELHVNLAYETSMLVWVHELGHCLGLAHSCEAGQTNCTLLERQAIMAYDGGVAGINQDDEAAIQALYGPPRPEPPPPVPTYRLVAPGAARD